MRICCAGEVMVEMAPEGQGGLYRRGVAGDTFNTAVYLARAGHSVSFLTRLGDDAPSANIEERLAAEGIATDLVQRSHGKQPGLYIIDNDETGERHFSYWREHSAARGMFDQLPQLSNIDAFYFSGITLAVTRSGKDNLMALLQQIRAAGGQVIFDPNYRPALWDSVQQARDAMESVLPLVDVALPTLADEQALWGVESVEDCRALFTEHGVNELVIKSEDLTAYAFAGAEQATLQAQKVAAIDTTGAGDAFNAGYLSARFSGMDLPAALAQAQALASQVVQHRGAIVPRS